MEKDVLISLTIVHQDFLDDCPSRGKSAVNRKYFNLTGRRQGPPLIRTQTHTYTHAKPTLLRLNMP